jgi:hypothetical protein
MNKNKYVSFYNNALLQSIIFYIILAVLLLPYYLYRLNPDGISYISIAQKYLLHDYSNAVNGYWGPLFSWMLLPFLFVGFKPLIAVKLLSLIIGVFTIIQSNSLIKILNIEDLFRRLLLYSTASIVLYFALIIITPDILFVFLGLGFINKILKSSYTNSKYAGIICGLFGSGLYLAKSYGFPFFIATFFIINLIFFLRSKNKSNRVNVTRNFISGIVVFSLISICWISIISNKYGYTTIGTAGSYNNAFTGPWSLGHPMYYMGLIDPPNNSAISIWEDVSFLKMKSWSIFESVSSFKFELEKIMNNIYDIIIILIQFSLLSIIFLLIAFTYLFKKGKQSIHEEVFFLVIILILILSSYAVLLVQDRYLWLGDILLLVISAKLLDQFFKIKILKKTLKAFLIVVFLGSFSAFPVIKLTANMDSGKEIFNLNNKISDLNIHGRIASNSDWYSSLYLSFYNGWHYYGLPKKSEELKTELENKRIDYYIVWKPFCEKIKLDEGCKEITDGKIDALRIYKLK